MDNTKINEKNINLTSFSKAISERYLSYALSTITSRSLPDVRDGLKPVHRRVLFAMRQLKLNYNQGYKKSARVVGDVMGKFHPHGDGAIYDSMVRMAQDFALRYPLVDGQGNFGNIDGDNAAAMRYTEARMTKAAELLLLDIDQNTVDFRVTYDDEGEEPVVLPSAFPNLLANGSQGIAVGMATSIPPHNISELSDALLHLIKFPNASDSTISNFVKGPDFPTGGIIIGSTGINSSYENGRGSIVIRGLTDIETNSKDRSSIIIKEIPYQVNKSRLVEQIADCVRSKKIEGISDLRDESDKDGVRVVIELKRDATPEVVLNQLHKFTPLQTSFGSNILALKNGMPTQFGIREILETFIEWNKELFIDNDCPLRILNKLKDILELWINQEGV